MLDTQLSIQKKFKEKGDFVLRPVSDSFLSMLQSVLEAADSEDPYFKSAAYFGLTGRNGLWIAQNSDTTVLISRHPNIDNEFLLFPPLGVKNPIFMAQVAKAIELTGASVTMARFTEKDLSLVGNNGFSRVDETVLDWAYDVHTIDTRAVADHRGKTFQHIRTDLNKFDGVNIEAADLDFTIHRSAVLEIAEKWSENDPDAVDVYERLLDLKSHLPLGGRIIFKDHTPVAFSIWEETDPKRGIANTFAMLADSEISGLSRFMIVDMCKTLSNKGFERTCLGGSENEGLDHFKRLLRPVHSLSVISLKPFSENAFQFSPQLPNREQGQKRSYG